MAFKIAKHPIKSDATVSVSVPGQKKPQEFTAKFEVMKHDEYRERTEGRTDDLALLKTVVVGWDGVVDDNGNEVAFSEEALEDLCQYTFVRTALLRSYNELMFGYTPGKKLEAVARYWAHGPTVNEQERRELTAEMRAFGATDEDIENYLKANTPNEDCIVIEENWPVLQWFLAIDDQFEYVQGVCTGIDIASIQADANMSAREYTPEQYKHLRYLTKCATRELNSRLEK